MPHILVVQPEHAEAELKAVYDEVLKRRGAIANVLRIHSLQPQTLKTHLDLYLSILYGATELTRQERESIAVAVSRANRCDYCVEHHADALSRYQKDGQAIAELKATGRSGRASEREKALVEFAHQITAAPHAITAKDIERLRKLGVTDEGVLMATLTAAYFNFVNRVVLALGVELEAQVKAAYKY